MPMRIIEYHRASTDDQVLTLGAQARSTHNYVQAQSLFGWESAGVISEHVSTRVPMRERRMWEAIDQCQRGEADGLIVVKLDRLTRSTMEFAQLLDLANHPKRGFRLVALDLGLDTETAGGKLVARIMAAVAEWERDQISERTKQALAEIAAQGRPLGARAHKVPRVVGEPLRARIAALSASGASTRAIARQLDAERVPTVRGGRTWSHSTVADLIRSIR